jgi:uncharacterized membrane protein YcaP (DUF421 family)
MVKVLQESLFLGWRAVVIYLVAMVMVKLMGKREVGQLSPLDFVVGVIIGSVASAPMVDINLPLLPTLVPLVVLSLLEIIASVLALKNRKIRLFLEDTPTIIIRDGQLIYENMAKIRMNIDDLKQVLREHGVVDVNEIEEGTMESGGKFSVIKKKMYQPLTRSDLQSTTLHNLDQVIAAYAQKAQEDLESLLDRRR